MHKEQLIHNATMEILDRVGIKFRNPLAIDILKNHGIRLAGDVAFFTEEQVMRWAKMAPSSFTLHARNPAYSMPFGNGQTYVSPAYGCAFIAERDGSHRPGTMADYVKCARLIQANEDFSICGGIMIQPADVPEDTAPIDMFYAALFNSDKVQFISTGPKRVMEAIMKAACALSGGEKEMLAKPQMITLINTNGPLSLDTQMLDCLMVFAQYGQPIIISPSTMLGTTGPITLAGTLASGNAENLAGIALAQMMRPGTPIIYGMQSTALDMRNAQYACAAPEGAIMQGFGAKMAAFYNLPSRGGGCLTDAPLVNAQAGYDSMLTYFSAYLNKINLVTQAGGVVASVKATSFDKMLCDFEIIRMVKHYFKSFEINENSLNMSDIKDIGHDGEFLTSEHTLDHCKEIFAPNLATRGRLDPAYYEENLDRERDRLLQIPADNPPILEQGIKDEIKSIVRDASGIDPLQLTRIESM